MKLLGGIYLIWLGISYFMALRKSTPAIPLAEVRSGRKILRDSILVEVLNPKTALFYLAFLPQFTDSSASLSVWAQIITLGTITNVMFSITDLLCIELSEAMTKRLAVSHRAGRLAQRVGGSILIALGVNLVTGPQ